MTEVDKKNPVNATKQSFVKGWARGIFEVQLIEGLTLGDNRDAQTALASIHDAGLSAGWHTQRALVVGQGYRVKRGQIERPVPEGQSQVASLDISEDVAVHTEESQAPLAEAVRTSSMQEPATHAVSTPISARRFVVRIFTSRTAQELGLADLVKEEYPAENNILPFPVPAGEELKSAA